MKKRILFSTTTSRLVLIFSLFCAYWGVLPAHTVRAATITVDNLTDGNDGSCSDGDCSLREAVDDATGGDTITFDSSLAGETITLSSQIYIDKTLTIDGEGLSSRIQIIGGPSNRVFDIGTSAVATLKYLDISGATAVYGGGIFNGGALHLNNCSVSGNTAAYGGAIYNDTGTITITESTFYNNSVTGYGGAINSYIGNVTVTASTFYQNHAGSFGGGIFLDNGAIMIMGNSTLFNNDSSLGGGIYNNVSTVYMSNNTFSENSATTAAGGFYNSAASSLHMANTILADSSSGGSPGGDCVNAGTISTSIYNLVEDNTCSAAVSGDPGLYTLEDNGGPTKTMAIGSGSSAVDAGDDGTCELVDQRGVVRPHGTDCDIGAFESAAGLEVNSTADPGSDLICDLSECTLREAIDVAASGDTITFDTDLAGDVITLGTFLDISKDLTIDASGLTPNISLNGSDTVQLMKVRGATVDIDHLDFVDGLASSGGAIENFDSVLTVSNSRFESNSAGDGGAINNNNADLTVTDCTFITNNASSSGGAIKSFQGTVIVSGSTLKVNGSDQYGGAIFNNDSTMTVTNSSFYLNDADDYGGGIFNFEGTLTVSNSSLNENSAGLGGGGIINAPSSTLHLKNTIVAYSPDGGDCVNNGTMATNIHNLVMDGSCSAAYSGDPLLGFPDYNGGPTETMALGYGSPAMENGDPATCELVDQRGVARPQGTVCDIGAYEAAPLQKVNSTNDPGDGNCNASECTLREAIIAAAKYDSITFDPALSGAVIILSPTIGLNKSLTIDGSGLDPQVEINGDGSQIFNMYGTGVDIVLDHLDLVDGSAASGGAIFNNTDSLSISNCSFDANIGNNGGAIYHSGGTLTISDTTFFNNEATIYGGALDTHDPANITGSTFTGNSAATRGGGVHNASGTMMIVNSTFYNNGADYGGGVYNANGTLTVSHSTLSENSADPTSGGGIYNRSSGTLHMLNTIIAGSIIGGDCENQGTITTNTANLIQDNSCSPAVNGDPLLISLADNGGPTETMALDAGSPALDAGDDGICEGTDQRGVSRPQGNHCDIGAYEKIVETTVGFYAPDTKIWRMRTGNTWSDSVNYLVWGPNGGGWTPVTGDWDNDGIGEVGFYDPVTKIWRMR
ncbi:MAG: choice-of-anchor Q domain-containing protein, partial [Anaerolineales bacterium]